MLFCFIGHWRLGRSFMIGSGRGRQRTHMDPGSVWAAQGEWMLTLPLLGLPVKWRYQYLHSTQSVRTRVLRQMGLVLLDGR